VVVQFFLNLSAYGLDVASPVIDLLQGLVFPRETLLRELGKDVPLQFPGNRALQQPLVASLDPSDCVKELDESFTGKRPGGFAGRVSGDKFEFFYGSAVFQGAVDKSFQMTVVAFEVAGRFGNSSGRIRKSEQHNHTS